MAKPVKKSDRNKEWRKDRNSRSRARSIAPEYHLIVSEGTETEPNYFKGMKDEIERNNAAYADKITVNVEQRHKGMNTIDLVKHAEQKVKDALRKSNKIYKHVWIVYDKDDFKDNDFDKAVKECENLTSETTEYHAIWSNESFELWFLLHFRTQNVDIHRENYGKELTKYLKTDYKKNDKDIYVRLRPELDTAIKNAEKIMEPYVNKQPSQCRPGTKVYEILKKLRPYLKSGK
ncbi:MAG: RloB domain-containing protein [Ruminococcus sp.]|nr:RloB domain-containing protein [Ruminococcus sp.]